MIIDRRHPERHFRYSHDRHIERRHDRHMHERSLYTEDLGMRGAAGLRTTVVRSIGV
jgi:hypothetical protein